MAYEFTINPAIGTLIHGPGRRVDGIPETVEWQGKTFDTPPLETLNHWMWDSVCETLEGGTIEPDGWDHEGCPSWLLALNLI